MANEVPREVRAEVSFQQPEGPVVDKGALSVLADFRPKTPRILQVEMEEMGAEYNIYDYPDVKIFDNWDENSKGAAAFIKNKLRLVVGVDARAVQEIFEVAEALLHNYAILNIDLAARIEGIGPRPQCTIPLGLNKALYETLGEL